MPHHHLLDTARYCHPLSQLRRRKIPISSTSGNTWTWSVSFCRLSELKGTESGTYICMHFTKCFHFSIVMITQITRDGDLHVYLAQMKQLPAEVQTEFDQGNCVVKGSPRRFNQVDPDQSQEWLSGTGKKRWRNSWYYKDGRSAVYMDSVV